MNTINSLIEISRKYGSNPEFVLGGGGNTSCKDNGILTVKASGFALGTIDENGFVKLDLKQVLAILENTFSSIPAQREKQILDALQDARLPEETLRPSVETILHALFPYSFVVHTHPAIINGLCCSNWGETIALELFKNSAAWLPYTTPGYILSKTVYDLFSQYQKSGHDIPHILMLQNHGIFVAADSPAEIDRLYETVISAILKKLSIQPDMSPVAVSMQDRDKIISTINKYFPDQAIHVANTRACSSFLETNETFKPLSEPFTPDHIVYAGAKPLYVKKDTAMDPEKLKLAINQFVETEEFSPKIIAVEKTGVFALSDTRKKAELAMALFLDAVKIASLAERLGGSHHMNKADIDFIKNWEVEHYRAKVTAEKKG